jgi:hypothetical protein
MTNKMVALWHVTHKENYDMINTFGIDPDMASGLIKRSWYVRWYGLLRAILHIAYKKGWDVQDMIVFGVKADVRLFVHFNRHIYTSKETQYPNRIMNAETAFVKIEAQRGYLREKK